jgi:hypothetical protein
MRFCRANPKMEGIMASNVNHKKAFRPVSRGPDPEIIVGRGKLRVMLDRSYLEIDLRTERINQYAKEPITRQAKTFKGSTLA